MNTVFQLVDETEDAPPADKAGLDAWADYQLEQIAKAQAQMAENADVAKRRIDIIARWCDEENAMLQNRVAYISNRIREHVQGSDYAGKKSRKLAYGEFGTRVHQAKLEVTDKAAAVAFAKAHDVPIRVKEEVDARELKAWAESTGLVPDGCTLHEKRDEWFVKAKGAE